MIKPHHVVMFAGKGGVGKTTCAGAAALHYASGGEPTLVISTDPTPSLSHLFQVGGKEKPVRVSDNLHLAELGLAEVKEMWDRKFGRDVYEVFSSFVAIPYEEFVDFMTSILPGLADEFMVDYIRELSLSRQYDHIVWDTAPLGQTLGLLKTPAMLREHLRPAPRIYSRLTLGAESKRSVMEIIKSWEILSAEDMEFLRSGVRFVLVTIPEALAAEQLDGIFAELGRHSFAVEALVLNNVVTETGGSAFLEARAAQQLPYCDAIRRKYAHLQQLEVPMFPTEVRGIERLRLFEEKLFPRDPAAPVLHLL